MNTFSPAPKVRDNVDTINRRVASAISTLHDCLSLAGEISDQIVGPQPSGVATANPPDPDTLCFAVNKLLDRANELRNVLTRVREEL